MKQYKLLKKLPFAKAGAIFNEWAGERNGTTEKLLVNKSNITINIWVKDIDNFNEWFEEVKEPELPKEFFYVIRGKISKVEYLTFSLNESTKQEYIDIIEEEKSVGNYFETKEEAEKYLEYLKAKVIIKQDTKGFKPDWKDISEDKYYGFWDTSAKKLDCIRISILQADRIYFETGNDIKESFEKHPEEWKAYLTYEQQD